MSAWPVTGRFLKQDVGGRHCQHRICDNISLAVSATINAVCTVCTPHTWILSTGCLSPALELTYKPIGILYEMVMGLDVSGNGGGCSLCKGISGAKSRCAQ